MIDRTFLENRKPAQSPINLDQGKPTTRSALETSGITLLFILCANLCLGVAFLLFPKDFETYDTPSKIFLVLRVIFSLSALYGSIVCVGYSRHIFTLTLNSWRSFYARLEEWDQRVANAFEAQQGLEVTRVVNEREISPTVLKDIIVAAILMHYYVKELDYDPSIRKMEQLYAYSNDRIVRLKVAEMLGTTPEKVKRAFIALGLIEGSKPGYSGYWVAESERDVIDLIVRNAGKIKELAYYD